MNATEPVTTKADPGRYETALPLASVKESKTNPRREFEPGALQELADSIRTKGLLQPIVVRPLNGGLSFELVCGARRFRAAKLAGLDALPASVRTLSDQEVLEIQVIENLQRRDLHELEEARGYQQLLATKGYDVARIAERVGRSPKYVYDRVKLTQLTKEAQELFLQKKFSAGHAILLARLKPADQARAIDPDRLGNGVHALFERSSASLFDGLSLEEEIAAEKKDPYACLKPVSVREFQQWIDDNVKFDVHTVDPMLFPETAAFVQAVVGPTGGAYEKAKKLIPITRDYRASDAVKAAAAGERIYGEMAWRRADGQEKSKTCDRSIVGYVACGPGRGEAFSVCVNKDKCEVHWGAEIRARQKRQKEIAKGGDSARKAKDDYAAEQRRHEEERKREQADRERWAKARPAILQALADAVKKAPTKATGLLAKLILDGLANHQARSKDVEKLVPRGTSAEDLVRHAAMIVVTSQASRDGWRAEEELVPLAKAFNVDAKAIRDQVAPGVQTSAKGEPGTCKRCGCTEDAACEGGCGWVNAKRTLCSRCATPADLKGGGRHIAKKPKVRR